MFFIVTLFSRALFFVVKLQQRQTHERLWCGIGPFDTWLLIALRIGEHTNTHIPPQKSRQRYSGATNTLPFSSAAYILACVKKLMYRHE